MVSSSSVAWGYRRFCRSSILSSSTVLRKRFVPIYVFRTRKIWPFTPPHHLGLTVCNNNSEPNQVFCADSSTMYLGTTISMGERAAERRHDSYLPLEGKDETPL
jgi:hypothetical protein